MIKNECKRLFFSKGMILSLILGLIIVIWHQVLYVWNPNVSMDNGLCMESAYYNWIGGNCGQLQPFLFYFANPLIVALPAGTTFFEDLHSGYIYHFCLRGVKKQYLIGKILGTFLTGALAVMIPLVISFLLTAMKFPLLLPEPINGFGPDLLSIDTDLYFRHPLIHTIVFKRAASSYPQELLTQLRTAYVMPSQTPALRLLRQRHLGTGIVLLQQA